MDLDLAHSGTACIEGFPSFQYTSLTTKNLLLRPPSAQDQENWVEIRTRNRDHLHLFEPQWNVQWNTQENYTDRLGYQKMEWRADRGYFFLIMTRETPTLIGGVNINNVVRGSAQFASLGYWIDHAHEGQGLMSEALDASLAFCFDVLKLQRLNAATLDHNHRSRKILERFHFQKEGLAKRYAEVNGTREDHVLYGLNASDFHQ